MVLQSHITPKKAVPISPKAAAIVFKVRPLSGSDSEHGRQRRQSRQSNLVGTGSVTPTHH